MRLLLAPVLATTITLTGACYQHAPRRGPLAVVADSFVPPASHVVCEEPREGYEHGPAFRECRNSTRTVAFEVTRFGQVLNVSQDWPDDSLGRLRAQALVAQLTRSAGRPSHPPSVDWPMDRWDWGSDSLCATLYRSHDGSGFLFVRTIGPCHSGAV